jgi:nucleoid DNA-binding protein
MNKVELVNLIAERAGNSKIDAERALTSVLDGIVFALGEGNDINLIGFGSFQVQTRKAREGRNPKTGEAMHIAAYKQPVFKAGKKLKDACN